MNIFVLDHDMDMAAQALVDKHVVKMPLETAQMLCHVHPSTPYRPTHKNHPCTRWIHETRGNFLWTCHYGLAVCKEYTYRYDKLHKCEEVILFCMDFWKEVSAGPRTPFAQAIPEKYKQPDAVLAYRSYYRNEKQHLATWKHRDPPRWWNL